MMPEFEDRVTSASEAEARLATGLTQMRTLSVQGLERLQVTEAARLAGQQREAERLERKLGAAHPRVAEVNARIELRTRAARDLGINVERGRQLLQRPAADRWIVHGFVRDAERHGLPGLTVALYDDAGAWVERAGYACTDDTGYFRLEVTAAGRRVPVERVSESAGPVTDASGRPVADAPDWFLRVKADERSLYSDTQALQPEPGRVDYREIILDRARAGCAPPERAKD